MDLTKLFEMQKVLDERIVKGKGLEGQSLLAEKVLALQVELGELANEWRGFKFWSEDKEPRTLCPDCKGTGYCHYHGFADPMQPCGECYGYAFTKNPMLEEYVDCLHFVLSIGLEVEDDVFDMNDCAIYIEEQEEMGVTEQFIFANWIAGCVLENQVHYEQALFSILELGKLLGFTWEQIETAYYAKNEINLERQNNGY